MIHDLYGVDKADMVMNKDRAGYCCWILRTVLIRWAWLYEYYVDDQWYTILMITTGENDYYWYKGMRKEWLTLILRMMLIHCCWDVLRIHIQDEDDTNDDVLLLLLMIYLYMLVMFMICYCWWCWGLSVLWWEEFLLMVVDTDDADDADDSWCWYWYWHTDDDWMTILMLTDTVLHTDDEEMTPLMSSVVRLLIRETWCDRIQEVRC